MLSDSSGKGRAMSVIKGKRGEKEAGAKAPKVHSLTRWERARFLARDCAEFSQMVWKLATARFERQMTQADQDLIAACASKDISAIRASVAAGADVNAARSERGETPLGLVAKDSFVEGVEELSRLGAKAKGLDDFGRSALFNACHAKSLECVRALLNAGADPLRRDDFKESPLTAAAMSGDASIMSAMLAAAPNRPKVKDALIESLAEVAREGLLPMAQTLLALGASVSLGGPPSGFDQLDADPAMAAASGKDKTGACLRAILEAGGNLYARNQLSQTMLMTAAKERNSGAIKVLISFGAPIEEVDAQGFTALSYAALGQLSADCALVLLAAGASPNHANEKGETPAHYSVSHAIDPRVAEAMLEAGADFELKNSQGESMLSLARKRDPGGVLAMMEARINARDLKRDLEGVLTEGARPSRRPTL